MQVSGGTQYGKIENPVFCPTQTHLPFRIFHIYSGLLSAAAKKLGEFVDYTLEKILVYFFRQKAAIKLSMYRISRSSNTIEFFDS